MTKSDLQKIIKAEVKKVLAGGSWVDSYKIQLITSIINQSSDNGTPIKVPELDGGHGTKFRFSFLVDGFALTGDYKIDVIFQDSGKFEVNESSHQFNNPDSFKEYAAYVFNLKTYVVQAVGNCLEYLENKYPDLYENALNSRR